MIALRASSIKKPSHMMGGCRGGGRDGPPKTKCAWYAKARDGTSSLLFAVHSVDSRSARVYMGRWGSRRCWGDKSSSGVRNFPRLAWHGLQVAGAVV